jgi:hypothetical protein
LVRFEAERLTHLPPVVTAPLPGFAVGGQLGSSATNTPVPIKLRWTGTDALSGVAQYNVEGRQVGASTWSQIGTVNAPTSFVVTDFVLMSKSYEFRVRGVDKAGNASSFVQGAQFKVSYSDDARPTPIAYVGKWTGAKVASGFLGTVSATSENGATATWNFPDQQVAYLAPTNTDKGSSAVTVTRTDGSSMTTTVSLTGPATPRVIVFAWDFGADGAKPKHTIQVRNLSSLTINLDAFLVIR